MRALEQAQKIYVICVESARRGEILTYRKVLDKLGYGPKVRGHAIRYGLELVWIACAHTKQPILTSIIVNQGTGEPNPDGYSVKSWKADAEKVMKWKKWLSADKIPWDYIWDNRAELSDKHATRGYWRR